jgi:hypothetical protein
MLVSAAIDGIIIETSKCSETRVQSMECLLSTGIAVLATSDGFRVGFNPPF